MGTSCAESAVAHIVFITSLSHSDLTPMKFLRTSNSIQGQTFSNSASEGAIADPPVTVYISRHVRVGNETAYEAALVQTIAAAKSFQGFRDAVVLKPSHPIDREYRVILHFDHCQDLRRWEQSKIRCHWLQQLDQYSVEPPTVQTLTGLETWFTLPIQGTILPPPRYKMLLLTWLAVFPVGTLMNLLISSIFPGISIILRSFLFTLTLVWLMTYLIMPRLTVLFARWLYPRLKMSSKN
jgi:uncharacterized protein